jgi:hypothetical protein
MCQQWFSMTGLVLEVVGFLLVAWEWRHVFESILLRQNAVEEDYTLSVEGEKAARRRGLADDFDVAKHTAGELEGQRPPGTRILFRRCAGG